MVGERISVWWSGDQQYYFGVVESYDKMHTVLYDDGERREHDLLTTGIEDFYLC